MSTQHNTQNAPKRKLTYEQRMQAIVAKIIAESATMSREQHRARLAANVALLRGEPRQPIVVNTNGESFLMEMEDK